MIHKSLEELIECSICTEEADDPRMLECQHVFCLSCLNKYISVKLTRGKIQCPLCREECVIPDGGASVLKKNLFHETIRDIIKAGGSGAVPKTCSVDKCKGNAVIFCSNECGYLCGEHEKNHSMFAKKHRLVDVSLADISTEEISFPHCEIHPKHELDLFCKTCQTPICLTCNTLGHKKHKCCDIQIKAREYKENIQRLVQTVGDDIMNVKEIIKESDEQIKKAGVEFINMENDVNKVFDQLSVMVEQKRKATLDELNTAMTESIAKQIEIKHKQDEVLVKFESVQIYGKQLLDVGKSYDYFTNTKQLQSSLKANKRQPIPKYEFTSNVNRNIRICPDDFHVKVCFSFFVEEGEIFTVIQLWNIIKILIAMHITRHAPDMKTNWNYQL